MLGIPPLHLFVFVRFSVTLPSPPQQTYFLIDPYKIYVVVPITETRIVREVKIRKLRLEKRFWKNNYKKKLKLCIKWYFFPDKKNRNLVRLVRMFPLSFTLFLFLEQVLQEIEKP